MDVAIIGAGRIADVHLQNVDDVDDVNVVAVCDLDADRAAAKAEPRGAASYIDHEEMFAEKEFDVLFIHLPPTAHTNQVKMAAERGVDVFLEKPLPLSADKLDELDRAIDESGIICQVGYMFRFADVVARTARLLDGRDLTLIRGHWFGGVPDSSWGKKRDRSGGQIVTTTTHIFDLARYFGGAAKEVSAHGSRSVIQDDIDFPDTSAATISHVDGVVSQVASTCTLSDDTRIDLLLVGDDVHLALDFRHRTLRGTMDGVTVRYREPDREYGDERLSYYEEYPFHRRNDYETEVRTFFEAVRKDDRNLVRSGYEDARATHELALAADESIETGESVRLRGGS